jgi:hypothetical protein
MLSKVMLRPRCVFIPVLLIAGAALVFIFVVHHQAGVSPAAAGPFQITAAHMRKTEELCQVFGSGLVVGRRIRLKSWRRS